MNPYLPIRKVPLDYNGVQSSAFSVQMNHPSPTMVDEWKECGVVGQNYMLLPNEDVKKAAKQVAKKVVKAPKKIIKAVSSAVGTVICTELYKQNLMSKEDHRLSWNFTIDNFSNTHINGYWYWAVPMVKLMKKNKLVTKFWNHVMFNRTKDIKWRLKKGKFNLLGRLYSMLIENGSYVVGKLISKKHKEVLA